MSSANPESLLAAGWERLDVGGFTGHVGPFWRRHEEGQRIIGLIVEDRHCNLHLGTVHGGVVMTFADIALGSGVSYALGHNRCATASLQTQFVAVARVGQFLTCKAEVIRTSKQLVFVRGLIVADDRIIANADGIWKVMEEKAA
jgi:uncharacterized protein (TIGR00369 family)